VKRTFIAIKIHPSEKLRAILDYFKQALSGEKIKWVDPENMHITIAFLGDTDENVIPVISEIIRKISLGFPPVELIFRGTGIFRNLRDPKVIWIGTETNPVLQNIKMQIDNELSGFGFKKEGREFRPHLTLGRIKWVKNLTTLEEAIDQYKDQEVQRALINGLIFYESILKPEGPLYLPILNAPLAKRD
jgi:2'-5' RNA ligase